MESDVGGADKERAMFRAKRSWRPSAFQDAKKECTHRRRTNRFYFQARYLATASDLGREYPPPPQSKHTDVSSQPTSRTGEASGVTLATRGIRKHQQEDVMARKEIAKKDWTEDAILTAESPFVGTDPAQRHASNTRKRAPGTALKSGFLPSSLAPPHLNESEDGTRTPLLKKGRRKWGPTGGLGHQRMIELREDEKAMRAVQEEEDEVRRRVGERPTAG
ncbi:hypothetical protein MMC13_001783 [Lambiella insularis]|nr:hypothetical protein [Lambiella insularis]